MKRNIKLALAMVTGFFSPWIARAVEFPNPAAGFLVDLGDKKNTFPELFLYVVNLALGIVGILSILFIVYGGFLYITSGGNDEQAETGKKALTNAIIGLAIVIMSYIIVTVIINAIGEQKV